VREIHAFSSDVAQASLFLAQYAEFSSCLKNLAIVKISAGGYFSSVAKI